MILDLLARFTQMSRETLGDNLLGVYLHGSAAMGCFRAEVSDLDLLLVVEHAVLEEKKLRFLQGILELNREAPDKGFELSVVRRIHCDPFVYPTPFELHFSNTWLPDCMKDTEEYVRRPHGGDPDLAAHITILHHFGKVLYGPPIAEVFAPVPKEAYFDSIWRDIREAEGDILEEPVYVILNLCRVLAYAQEGKILSKKAGGEWGAERLPKRYGSLAGKALAAYTLAEPTTGNWDDAEAFARYMLREIKKIKER